MEKSIENQYISALKFNWLTPFYDLIVGMTTRERTFKGELIRQAGLLANHDVLDLASGTGTMTIWSKEAQPLAKVIGLDGDPSIIAIAERKAATINTTIHTTTIPCGQLAGSFARPIVNAPINAAIPISASPKVQCAIAYAIHADRGSTARVYSGNCRISHARLNKSKRGRKRARRNDQELLCLYQIMMIPVAASCIYRIVPTAAVAGVRHG